MALYDPEEIETYPQLKERLEAEIGRPLMQVDVLCAVLLPDAKMHASAVNRIYAAYDVDFQPGPQHVENLLKLAQYLLSLPRDYKEFGMGDFCEKYSIPTCGTVACAVGHGPIALGQATVLGQRHPYDWTDWSNTWLGPLYQSLWDFMFGGDWEATDNTPYGAAARIVTGLLHPQPMILQSPAAYVVNRDDGNHRLHSEHCREQYSGMLEPLK